MLGVPIGNVFEALQVYIGSAYVNDFNRLGRTFRVTAQADAPYRDDLATSPSSRCVRAAERSFRSAGGDDQRPDRALQRQPPQPLPGGRVGGDRAPGLVLGPGDREDGTDRDRVLPPGFGFEWTELAYPANAAGNTGFVFVLAVLFVFLVLSAQYRKPGRCRSRSS